MLELEYDVLLGDFGLIELQDDVMRLVLYFYNIIGVLD